MKIISIKNNEEPEFDRQLIASLPATGPRYTSYPTADRFHDGFRETEYVKALELRGIGALNKPLSLYIHIPWCIQKCPYCDFNSHRLKPDTDEAAYVNALLTDLQHELPHIWGRSVETIFIGGGTPSVFSAESVSRLLSGVRALVRLQPEAEITLEANPGTFEQARFQGYAEAGITRLSLGIQSFDNAKLQALGRIHNGDEAGSG